MEAHASRRLRNNVLSQLAGRLITVASMFLSYAILGRVLGPSGFGPIALGLALSNFFVAIIALGFETFGTRDVARNPRKVRSVASRIISARLPVLLLSLCIYGALAWLLSAGMPSAVGVLMVFATPMIVSVINMSFVFQGLERMHFLAFREAGTALLSLAGAALFVHKQSDILMGAIVLAAAQVFNICALFVGYCWEFGLPRLGFRRRALLATFRRVFAMLGSTMLMAIYSVVDILVLSYLGSAQAVGLFGAANRIRTLVNTTCVILLTSYTPVLARSAGNTAEMHRHGSDYAKIMYLAVAPIALFLAIFSADAMSFAFGAQFIAAAPALSILMFVLLLAAVNMTHGNPLLVWGRERYFMFSVLMAAGLNAVMNTLLIPRFGVYGAAWADLATEMFLFGRYILHFRRLGLVPHLRLLGLCLFVAAIANGGSYLIVFWLMPDMAAFFRLLAGGCLMLLFYAGLVSVTGVLDLLRLGRALSAKIWPG